jgi:uncharacterized integral membrane protein
VPVNSVPGHLEDAMKSFRFIVVLVVAILVLIVILQNMEAVDTRILFVTITMPRAALLFITLVIGFIAGLILAATGGAGRRPTE